MLPILGRVKGPTKSFCQKTYNFLFLPLFDPEAFKTYKNTLNFVKYMCSALSRSY